MVGVRCCIKCKDRKPKEEFYRIVASDKKDAILDIEQNINKRGIYICKNKECLNAYINMLRKNKAKLKIEINHESLIKVLETLLLGLEE